MLAFDPDKRITAEKALEHTYLKDLFQLDDMINSDSFSKFDFLFEEKEELSKEEVRKYIIDEMLLYHDGNHYEKYILNKKAYMDQKEEDN